MIDTYFYLSYGGLHISIADYYAMSYGQLIRLKTLLRQQQAYEKEQIDKAKR